MAWTFNVTVVDPVFMCGFVCDICFAIIPTDNDKPTTTTQARPKKSNNTVLALITCTRKHIYNISVQTHIFGYKKDTTVPVASIATSYRWGDATRKKYKKRHNITFLILKFSPNNESHHQDQELCFFFFIIREVIEPELDYMQFYSYLYQREDEHKNCSYIYLVSSTQHLPNKSSW